MVPGHEPRLPRLPGSSVRVGAPAAWARLGLRDPPRCGLSRALPLLAAFSPNDLRCELAKEKEISPAQLALAWVLAQGQDIVLIPGTKRRKYVEENAAAAEVELTGEDFARIDEALPEVEGERYPPDGMATVNL